MFKKAPIEPAPAPTPVPEIGKGRATPSRREQELARKRPLVPTDRKTATRTARADAAIERNRARIGMAAGEEKYLLRKDRGPQRRFLRDSVDARWMLGELVYPVIGVLLVVSFAVPTATSQYLLYVIWSFALFVVIDGLIAARTFRRRLADKHGADNVDKGHTLYVITRSIQFRGLRTPKPQVKRGQHPK